MLVIVEKMLSPKKYALSPKLLYLCFQIHLQRLNSDFHIMEIV